MDKGRKNEWSYHPIVIIAGILVFYSASSSIVALFNL